MDDLGPERIDIDEAVAARIAALARGQGQTASDLANDVLRAWAEDIDRATDTDTAEDERRWQEYLRTGEAIPFEQVEKKLLALAEKARSSAKNS